MIIFLAIVIITITVVVVQSSSTSYLTPYYTKLMHKEISMSDFKAKVSQNYSLEGLNVAVI